MRAILVLLLTAFAAATSIAGDLSPKDLVAQLYQAHNSKHDPLDETALLGRYFDPALLKLYLKDMDEAKGEVGRLDGDPLYNAQDMEIKDFSVSAPEMAGVETRVTVNFKNLGKRAGLYTRLYVESAMAEDCDIHDDGSSLKKISCVSPFRFRFERCRVSAHFFRLPDNGVCSGKTRKRRL
jgi:hypothetical protein